MNKTSVDAFLEDGCGRCAKYQTPACKVHQWTHELIGLRTLVRATGLVEEMKWGFPCYSLNGKNVVMVQAFKEFCALQFFKGAALVDEAGVLESPGPNSRFGRFLKFRSLAEFKARKGIAKELLDQAIALEHAGIRVDAPPANAPVPAELAERLKGDSALRKAFEALTPGRRRSHVLHVSSAKQSETRVRRVDKCAIDIFAGRGFNERD